MTRAVITGIGVVGPNGVGKDRFWEAILNRISGIERVTRFDPTGYASQVAGEVRDRSYEDLIEPRKLRNTAFVTQITLAASELALRDAKLDTAIYPEPERGVFIGTALGGWREAEQQYAVLLERGARRVNPFLVSGAGNHSAGLEVAAAVGAQGAQVTFSSGCPSSVQAIAHGAALVRAGELGFCLAGGFEAPISPLVFAGLGRTQELSTLNDEPARASRPFDRGHAGMVLSEGSCLLTIEAEEQAIRRGARIYATILGSGFSCDAQGLYAGDATGEVPARALRHALTRSGVEPTEVDYVCSHANSLPAFDRKDAGVLQLVFGEQVGCLPVSSIKGVLGHPFGASGAFQTAAASLALEQQTLPPNANLDEPDSECRLNLMGAESRPARIRHALVTSYGYGGVNGYLVLGRP